MRRLGFGCLGVCICLFGLTGAAPARTHAKRRAIPRVVLHWPNSPIRHLKRLRSSTNSTPSFSANLRGGVAFAGNTMETCPENVSAHKHRVKKRRHSRKRSQDSAACVGANNNDHNMVYVNVDPSGGHFNSSSATLSVPAGARVVKAFLYWAADLSEGVNRPTPNGPADAAPGGADPDTNTQWKKADLRVGSGSYSTIDATDPTRNGVWKGIASWYSQPGQDPGFAYQVRADVTAEVNAGLTATRRRARSAAKNDPVDVTVANVQAGKGYNRYAGWNLLVVWQTPTAAYRNITIFDGFDFVQVEGGQQLVVGPLNFTGFDTPPNGKVDAHVTTWTTEGDRAITGDYLALGAVSDTCDAQKPLTDALHPANNFFNSTISRDGTDDGDRTPDYSNQMGFDLATVDVPEGTIPNAANGASVCLGTNGDTYFFGGIVFDTLIQAPNLQISKVADKSTAAPGDTVTYTTEVTNPQRSPDDPLGPTAPATVTIADPLPSGLHFSGFVDSPPCTFNAATDTINCDAGTLPPDGSFTYSFTATVTASAQGPAPNPVVNTGCFNATAPPIPGVFTGCDDATIIVPPTPPPQPQPADLGVVKTVSAKTVAPGDTITWKIVGTNYGPATSTGFVLADQLPPGVDFVSATAESPLTCTTPPVGGTGAVTCTAPSVPPKPAAGSSLTLTIVATVPADAADGSLLLNVATVKGDQDEPAPDPHPNRDETVTRVVVPDQPIPPPNPVPPNPPGPPEPPVPQPPEPPTPDVLTARLSLHKQATPSMVIQGGMVTFTLRVKNVTEVSALKVRVCDTLPHGLAVVSAPGFKVSGRTACKSVGTLKVLATKTVRFTARVGPGAASRVTNTATATASNARTVHARARIRVVPSPAVTG
jgi:large repetitive protein